MIVSLAKRRLFKVDDDEVDDPEPTLNDFDEEETVAGPSYDIYVRVDAGDEPYAEIGFDDVSAGQIADFLAQYVNRAIKGYSIFGHDGRSYSNTVYLPAARTGIMLALDYFVSGAFSRAGLSNVEAMSAKQVLAAPIRSVAATIARNTFIRPGQSGVLDNVLNGRVMRGKSRTTFMFEPKGSKLSIPLASISSLVTELAAISLVSSRANHRTFLILEEPEAHLYLDAQREVAKIIAKLVNKGMQILITTHSDTFIQQVNNLICLSDHPKRDSLLAEFDIDEFEVISRDLVVAYDFRCENGATTVDELGLMKTGFIPSSLKDVLIRLAKEAELINRNIADI